VPDVDTEVAAAELYLDLLKKCLRRTAFDEQFHLIEPSDNSILGRIYAPIRRQLAKRSLVIVQHVSEENERAGQVWPSTAETMLSEARLDNIQDCVTQVLRDDVPGDLLEAGVWRGGGSILMRGVLKAYGVEDRKVWAADSFEGLPKPDPARYPADAGDTHWTWEQLAVSLDEVKRNFARYGLLDAQVEFLKGWFRDTLPNAPIDRLAVLRVDGDMYEGTIDPLEYLYSKLARGGMLIVDDYGAPNLAGSKKAVDDYRFSHHINEPIVDIDGVGIFWRKT
jgi:O-methyltransferase